MLLSPKKRAREAVLTKALRDGVALKVRAPAYGTQSIRPMDPLLPVKKRPILSECSAVNELKADLPAKKKVSSFLLEDPPSMLPSSPPGLSLAPPGLALLPR
jgi:hypothetical protein